MLLNHFKPQELVPQHIYNDRGAKSIQLLDRELLVFIDFFHDYLSSYYGGKVSIKVNDWLWKGRFQYRGLRDENCPQYSKYSQHTYGKALDFDVYVDGRHIPAAEIRQIIIDNYNKFGFTAITFIEDGVNWVHVDTRPTDNDILVVWNVDTHESVTYLRGL